MVLFILSIYNIGRKSIKSVSVGESVSDFFADYAIFRCDRVEYYEVECGNHHQSDFDDKCDKLKSFTRNLFFITPNRETAEKKLKPQIEQWIKARGRSQLLLSGVTVYLTGISDLAQDRWTYVYNMQDEKPIYTPAPTKKKEE